MPLMKNDDVPCYRKASWDIVFLCPKMWENLEPTENDTVHFGITIDYGTDVAPSEGRPGEAA